MPELPEMQALAERLADALRGQTLEAVTPIQFAALATVTPAPETLLGETLRALGRRGKFLTFRFDTGRLLIHLSQGGRIDLEMPPKRTRPKNGVVRLTFGGGRALFVKEFGTERKARWWVLAPGDEGPLAPLGPEPDDPAFATFITTGDDKRRVHTLLRDQRTVAGIGRGYADDALHRARISPYATLAGLSPSQRAALIEAIREVLDAALASERARTGGLPAKLGDRFTVHNRYGAPCPVCGTDLRRVSFESHEITYCPACQTGGKILADRRMSRLIK